jgi:hypothetical protein
MTSLDERLNTTAVATLTGIALAYLCSFVHPALPAIALLSIIPLYFAIQRNHTRYELLRSGISAAHGNTSSHSQSIS